MNDDINLMMDKLLDWLNCETITVSAVNEAIEKKAFYSAIIKINRNSKEDCKNELSFKNVLFSDNFESLI